jgi:hypothetical protein
MHPRCPLRRSHWQSVFGTDYWAPRVWNRQCVSTAEQVATEILKCISIYWPDDSPIQRTFNVELIVEYFIRRFS